jgi:hypothetical protein
MGNALGDKFVVLFTKLVASVQDAYGSSNADNDTNMSEMHHWISCTYNREESMVSEKLSPYITNVCDYVECKG